MDRFDGLHKDFPCYIACFIQMFPCIWRKMQKVQEYLVFLSETKTMIPNTILYRN